MIEVVERIKKLKKEAYFGRADADEATSFPERFSTKAIIARNAHNIEELVYLLGAIRQNAEEK